MMDDPLGALAQAACRLADRLPPETIQLVARLIAESKDHDSARWRISEHLSQPFYRDLALSFVEAWKRVGTSIQADGVALCLLTASQSECRHRAAHSVELVWTGPDSGAVPFRQTEQALLQVLDSAQQRITLVSYAVYKIAHVSDALVRAARRGVRINVIVETPDPAQGEQEYDTIRSLGEDIISACRVFYWPSEHRPCHESGKRGILHVKCLVADGRWLFVSSANLTQYAFTINMELGVLLSGGPLPPAMEAHFDRLIAAGALVPTCDPTD